MFVRPPDCGLTKHHDAHYDHPFDRHCQGWTDEQEAVERLCILLTTQAQLQELYPWEKQHLKLYAHPSVYNALARNVEPDFSSFPEMRILPPKVEVEIVTDPELPEGSWRFEIARGAM
jgi:hypothetical protein